MKKAFLYIRVSTDEQADTGYSQRSQHEILTRYCELNNISVVQSFFEDHSAKTFSRPEFTKLLMTIRKHKNMVTLVLFTKWDRFSRNAGDAYQMISTLNKLGVEPQAIEQPLNLEIPENKMMLAFYLAAPEVENDRRALNVMSGMRRAQKEGRYMGKAPCGYLNKISDNGRKYIIPCEKSAPLIVWIFEQISTGQYTVESIWKQAKLKGYKGSKNAFWNTIRNPLYMGKIKVKGYKDEKEYLVNGKHEGIVSESLFYEVQDILTGRRKSAKTAVTSDERFPLRGFLKCPECNKMLTASASKGRSMYYGYYHCTSSCGVRFKADCVNDSFIKELSKCKLHPGMKELYKIILHDTYSEQSKNRTQELTKIKDEIARLNDRQNKARNLLLSDSLDPEDYRSIKKECETSILGLERQLAEISTIFDYQPVLDKALNILDQLDKIYKEADIILKREIIGSMFPEKLEFNGEHYRTARINEAARLICSIGKGFSEIKKGTNLKISALSPYVIPLGLEPRTHTLKVYCSTN